MTASRWLTSVAITVCLAWGVCAGQSAPPQLITTDEELAGYLTRARELIDEGTYELAIEILQSILSRSEVGFVSSDSRHFYSLRQEVSRTIGQLPPAGLAIYRTLYDPPAERLYEQAVAAGDTAGLARIVAEYLHTSAGVTALDTMAQHAFDRMHFAQAGRYWADMLELDIPDETASLTLARMAVAYHFAQDPTSAQEALKRLENEYPGARAAVAGSERPLVDFVEEMWQRPIRAGAARALSDWPGMGGVPSGIGIMADCAAADAPKWRYPAENDGEMLVPLANALEAWESIETYYSPYGGTETISAVLKIRDGQVLAQYTVGGTTNTAALPAMVQPVLAGDVLVFRNTDKIIALDIRSGELRWEADFPAEVATGADDSHLRHYGPFPLFPVALYDSGHYALTVADGKVFAVGESLSASARLGMMIMSSWRDDATTARPAVLSAFSVRQDGKLLWSTRTPADDDVELSRCNFISPPTVWQGRLYVLAIYMESYYLYCLDAESGAMLWRSYVCQMPAVWTEWGWQTDPNLVGMLYRGSPPAVDEGRVAVLTNAGVVSAFDAGTGRSLWAYQYDSRVNDAANAPNEWMHSMQPAGQSLTADNIVRPPINPVIMTGGRVIVLPADGQDLLCLAADNGRPLWNRPRHGQYHLSALDHDRMLLSHPSLLVCSAATGEMLFEGKVSDVVGRPAVMRRAALLSGRGKLYRLDLSTVDITDADLTSSMLPADGAITGNLITAAGRVISANALGVCSYVDCDVVRAEITEMLSSASPDEQVAMYYERGWLAFYVLRFDEAYEDFTACKELADRLGLEGPPQLRNRLYLSCVGLANQADDPEEMMALFDLADTYAQTDQEMAHNRLRKAKYYRDIGDFETAARMAHEIADRYGDQELVDVPIGPDANVGVRFDEKLPRVPAAELIHGRFLLDMIRKYGQESYAVFDAKAQAALARARADDNPSAMLAIAASWPNSMWADDALYAAAEVYYLRAASAADDGADELLADACRALARVANWRDSPLAAPAQMALAVIYRRQGKSILVADACWQARSLARHMVGDRADAVAVSFADVQGTLGELAEGLTSGQLAAPADGARSETLAMPVRRRFSIPGVGRVVRDGRDMPLMIDGDAIVVTAGHALRVDPAADDAEAAVRWRCELPAQPADAPAEYDRLGPFGVVDPEGRTVAVTAGANVVGIDVETGELRWETSFADLDVAQPVALGGGDGLMLIINADGGVCCVAAADGKVKWRSSLGVERVAAATVRVVRQVAVVADRYAKVVKCYSLRADGKELRRWQGNSSASAATIGQDIVAVMVDGSLTVYDVGVLDDPLWERSFPAGSFAAILGAGREGVVVGYAGRGACRIEVLSTLHGETTSRIETAQAIGTATAALGVTLADGELYVFCTPVAGGSPPATTLLSDPGQRVFIQKYDLAGGTLLWQRDYTPESPGRRPLFEPTFTDEYVLTGFGENGRAYVLSQADGRPVAGGRFEAVMGRPAVVAGRLIMPEKEGVVFYGSK